MGLVTGGYVSQVDLLQAAHGPSEISAYIAKHVQMGALQVVTTGVLLFRLLLQAAEAKAVHASGSKDGVFKPSTKLPQPPHASTSAASPHSDMPVPQREQQREQQRMKKLEAELARREAELASVHKRAAAADGEWVVNINLLWALPLLMGLLSMLQQPSGELPWKEEAAPRSTMLSCST